MTLSISCGNRSSQERYKPASSGDSPSSSENATAVQQAPSDNSEGTTLPQGVEVELPQIPEGSDTSTQETSEGTTQETPEVTTQETSEAGQPMEPSANDPEAMTPIENGTETTEDPCVLALNSFVENINPVIESSCAGCHAASTEISGTLLSLGANEANRAVFLSYDATPDGTLLFAKISGDMAHGGGVLDSVLPLANIMSWKEAEAGCVIN